MTKFACAAQIVILLASVGCSEDDQPADGNDAGLDSMGQPADGPADVADAGDGNGNEAAVRAALEEKSGTFMGSWELFGLDEAGERQRVFGWTDVATTSMPTVEAMRAFVHVSDVMMFEGGGGTTEEWIEGVVIEADGSVGDSFVDQRGVVTIQEEVEPDHFVYEMDITPMDLMGLPGVTMENLIEGHHTMDKHVTRPGGVETHAIERTTHVVWMDAERGRQAVDYVSLTGTHRRQM